MFRAQAIRIHDYGDSRQLVAEDIDVAEPGTGEIVLRQHAVGINFIDIYQRTGLYKLPSLPAVLGLEGAGEVLAIGSGVSELKVGDRVAYAGCPGGYASARTAPADRMVPIPDSISYQTAAAMMLQGMTVRYLLRETYRVSSETTLLFHAAAGGVGLIACQWAKAIGATMIGTVSSSEKADKARQFGCTHVIDTSEQDFVARTMELTDGRGCDVVYDSIGKDTFPQSLACLKPKGLWVSFGNASGPVPPFALAELKGSLFVTRPSLFAYVERREDLLANANDLFSMVGTGAIKIDVSAQFPLAEAAEAHRALESRRTTGSVVLVP